MTSCSNKLVGNGCLFHRKRCDLNTDYIEFYSQYQQQEKILPYIYSKVILIMQNILFTRHTINIFSPKKSILHFTPIIGRNTDVRWYFSFFKRIGCWKQEDSAQDQPEDFRRVKHTLPILICGIYQIFS